jgi:PAS domain S-box-containing protein
MKALLKPNTSWMALGIGLLYALLGVLWILGSDALVESISSDAEWRASAQRYKGVLYVLGTSVALVFLVHASYRRLFRALGQVEATELRVRDLFLQHPKPMWVYDLETLAFLAVNDAAIRHYGYSRAEFMAMTLKDIRSPEDMPELLLHHTDITAVHRDVGVVRHRKKSGDILFAHIAMHKVDFAQRKAAMVMAIDVTAEVLSQRAVERQAAQFRQLHHSLADVLWMASPDGRTLLYVSPAIESIYGLTPEQVTANPEFWLQAIHPDDAAVAQASHQALLATGEASCEYRIVTPSGDIKWVFDRKRLIVDDEGLTTMMGGILEDITSDKAHEARLAASHDELEKLVTERTAELVRVNAELDAFARTIAHDLRSPLVSVVGFTQLLQKRHAATLGEDGAKLAARIERSARQMGSLVSDLLSLSRASTHALIIQDVDLVPLAHEILDELQHQEPERRVRLDSPKSLHVRGDLGLVRPLLANLLGNAWKFTGKRNDAHIQLLPEATRPDVVVRIQDNGVGFDATDAGLLFKPFQRFHTLSEFSGTGIGLTTCERIMTRHGGKIHIESAPGEGTSVFLSFVAPAENVTPA